MSRASAPVTEVAAGVFLVVLGRGALAANVYFVRSGGSWVLVDAGWSRSGDAIRQAAGSVFGPGMAPTAIALTHIHPDHSGSAGELARAWHVPVFVQPAELPLAAGALVPEFANPLDQWLVAPILKLMPAKKRAALTAAGSLIDVIRGIDVGVPGLVGWECIATPGHTPGHVAYFRRSDGVLITGDAVLTIDLNSISGYVRGRAKLAGPPRYSTWKWFTAIDSIMRLAVVRPNIVLPGHGRPMAVGAANALATLANRLAPLPARS
jgi:glyoxylase-like metal-dependent hydrolase (beta-lactamase superfamily II)